MEKEQLINCLKDRQQKSLTDLARIFKKNEETIAKELTEYLDTGLIVATIKGYMLTSECRIFLGTIVLRKDNFAYIMPYGSTNDKKNDIRVSGKSLEGYIIGDKVYFQVDNWSNGTIVGLYKRTEFLSGTVFKSPNSGWLMKVNQTKDTNIDVILKEDVSKSGVVEGDLVKAKIITSAKDAITVSYDSTLAKADEVGADISAIIASHDAPLTFPSEVLVQAKMISQTVDEKDIPNREDYRNEVIVTIDGEDALDFDDAVSCKKIVNGYQVGVYIADVSYYVRPNTPLDQEAQKRGTSIYVADRVIPMLPKELSNGICSLNPHVDRFVLSVIMDIDEAGNVYRSSIHQGVINSHGRLTYKQVNDLFEKKSSKAEVITSEISDMLFLMKQATDKIRGRRERNGALDLDSTELKFNLDENGNPTEVIKREQGKGEMMIEDLMIIANVEVAKFLSEKHIPTLYRVHDNPPSEKISLFTDFLKNIRMFQNFPKKITSASLSHWYSSISDEKIKYAISGFLLRSLAKAKYTPDNSGHFGLAEEFYLHFTSPIRRYPDLIVHRTLRDYYFHKEKFDEKRLYNALVNLGLSTSESEKKADTIEREVDDLESCKYMSKHIGENFKGVISGITSKGMYIELSNGIEAYVAISDIDPSQKWIYSDKHMNIQGTQRDENDRLPFYRLGTEMDVIISNVTFEDRTIHATTVATDEFRKSFAQYQEESGRDSDYLKDMPDYKRFKIKSRNERYSSSEDYGYDNYRDDRGNSSFGYRDGRSSYSSDRRGFSSRDRFSSDRPYNRDDRFSPRGSFRKDDGSSALKGNYSHRQTEDSKENPQMRDASENAELTRFVSATDSQDVLEAKRKFYSDRPIRNRRPSSSRNSFSGGRGGYSSDRRGGSSRGSFSDRRSSYSRKPFSDRRDYPNKGKVNNTDGEQGSEN